MEPIDAYMWQLGSRDVEMQHKVEARMRGLNPFDKDPYVVFGGTERMYGKLEKEDKQELLILL